MHLMPVCDEPESDDSLQVLAAALQPCSPTLVHAAVRQLRAITASCRHAAAADTSGPNEEDEEEDKDMEEEGRDAAAAEEANVAVSPDARLRGRGPGS